MRGWSNRDRTLWLCDPALEQDEQQAKGIRVDVRIRSHVRDTGIAGGRSLKDRGWIKSVFYRPRTDNGAWDRIQREQPMKENVQLPHTWSDMVIFSHRDCRASRAYIVLTGRDDVKKPPIPPQPSRFMISTDDDFGDIKVITPKTEPPEESSNSSDESSTSVDIKIETSKDDTSSTRIKSESRCVSSVGLMARDPGGPNFGEIVIGSDSDVEVPEHGPISIQPEERTTTIRKLRRIVLDGISQLNQHNKMIQLGLGLTSNSNSGQKTIVFTSHPLVFMQESGDAVVDVIDVGVGAGHLSSVGDPKDWCKLFEGYHNIVFAIGYDTPEDPLLHGAFWQKSR